MLKKRAKLLNFTGMESTVGHSGFTKIAEYYHSFFKIEGIFLHRFLSLLAIKPACLNIKIFSKNPNRRPLVNFKKICLVCLIVFFEKRRNKPGCATALQGIF